MSPGLDVSPLWRPGRLWSLWDMLRLDAPPFVAAIGKLAILRDALEEWRKMKPDEVVPRDGTATEGLHSLKSATVILGAVYSEMSIDRALAKIASGVCTYSDLFESLATIEGRIHDELSRTYVFVVGADGARYLDETSPAFGEAVSQKFPSATYDIAEASKCLGLRRATACVTHLMRVLEFGLASLGTNLGVSVDRKNWHVSINEMEKVIKGMDAASYGPDWKANQEFCAGAAVHFRLLKDGWRNHAMHAHTKYTEEEAKTIFDSVRAFMRHLSQRLSEQDAE